MNGPQEQKSQSLRKSGQIQFIYSDLKDQGIKRRNPFVSQVNFNLKAKPRHLIAPILVAIPS